MKNALRSNKIFARLPFVMGISSVLDMGGTLQVNNPPEIEKKMDIEALKNDWEIVGENLNFSISIYEQELSEPSNAGCGGIH